MLKEDLQPFDEVVCTKNVITTGCSVIAVKTNTHGYYLPPQLWSKEAPELVFIFFLNEVSPTATDLREVLLQDIQLVKRNSAEELVNHSCSRVKREARDKVLSCLLKKGPVQAMVEKTIDRVDSPRFYWSNLSEGERFVIVKRKKCENFVYLKETTPEISQSREYILKDLSVIDWSTLSLLSKEELLTSANRSLRELAVDKNALLYGKLITRFKEQQYSNESLFRDLLNFLNGGLKGNGFGLTNFPVVQRKKLLEVLKKEFSPDLIKQTVKLKEDLGKTFSRLEESFNRFVEEEKTRAKEAFNQEEEE